MTSPVQSGPSPVDSGPAEESKPQTEHEPTVKATSEHHSTIRGPSALGGLEMTE